MPQNTHKTLWGGRVWHSYETGFGYVYRKPPLDKRETGFYYFARSGITPFENKKLDVHFVFNQLLKWDGFYKFVPNAVRNWVKSVVGSGPLAAYNSELVRHNRMSNCRQYVSSIPSLKIPQLARHMPLHDGISTVIRGHDHVQCHDHGHGRGHGHGHGHEEWSRGMGHGHGAQI
jgi:hypothetical protein